MSGTGIGMMDPAYFVGRKAIVEWCNASFQMALSKVEETSSGAVACQILDAIYPGEVPMSKVRWDAAAPHQSIENYKIVQNVFERRGIDKHIEVERLMRGKYQDNLEMMQWFKSFFEKNYGGQPYDPIARRARGKGADATPAFALDAARRAPVGTHSSSATATASAAPSAAAPASADSEENMAPPSRKGAAPSAAQQQQQAVAPPPPTAQAQQQLRVSASSSSTRGGRAAALGGVGGAGVGSQHRAAMGPGSPGLGAGGPALEAARAKIADLGGQVADLHLSVESLEKERDFYFSKLRDIEIMLQTYAGPDPEAAAAITKILYATDDDFVAVEGGGAEA